MGIYYALLNDTKRQSVHLAYHIKRGPLTQNKAVHFALCRYMMDNLGDTLRLCGDNQDDGCDYEDVDLLRYRFSDPSALATIVGLLNEVYGYKRYGITDGVGCELPNPPAKGSAPAGPV